MRRAAPALAAVAAWALFAALAFSFWRELPAHFPLDGQVDWALARAFLAGDNPYTPEGMARHRLTHWSGIGHPPTTGLWFLPLATLPIEGLSQGLGAIVILALAAHLLLVCRELKVPFAAAVAGLLATLIVRQEWFLHHLVVAQISELIAFLLVVAWLALRRGGEAAAGVAVGLACTLKLFPGVAALFLLATGRRRAFLAAAVTYLAAAAVVTVRFGPSSWWLFLQHQGPIAQEWVGKSYNFSLEGLLLRLAHPGTATAPLEGWVTVVYPLLAAALLGGALWLARRRAPELDLSFALVASLGAFLNPWIWPHYRALLILPWLVMAAALVRAWGERRRSALAPAVLLLAALVFPVLTWPASIAALALLLAQSTSLPKKLTSLPR